MIEVDLQSAVPLPLLSLFGAELMNVVLDDVAEAARAKWIQLAQTELRSSKRDYIAGIQPVQGRGDERFIALVGVLPNMVERGIEPFDLRDTLLKGAKESAAGHRYRAIPFRHGTPGSQGQAGMPMGARYGPQGAMSRAWASEGAMEKGAATKLGKRVYRAAKALEQGQRLQTSERRRRGFIQVPRLAPWHKSDIYKGMRRETKTYERATQAQYMTFRTISEANPQGWIHPGIEARNLAPRVEAFVQPLVEKAIKAALEAAIGQLR